VKERRHPHEYAEDLHDPLAREILPGVADECLHREHVGWNDADVATSEPALGKKRRLHAVDELVVDDRATAKHAEHDDGRHDQTRGAHGERRTPKRLGRSERPEVVQTHRHQQKPRRHEHEARDVSPELLVREAAHGAVRQGLGRER
jgi:hypothetical protein